jgi:hypothetical protein
MKRIIQLWKELTWSEEKLLEEQFVDDHGKELGEDYAREFWRKYNN